MHGLSEWYLTYKRWMDGDTGLCVDRLLMKLGVWRGSRSKNAKQSGGSWAVDLSRVRVNVELSRVFETRTKMGADP